MSRPSAPGFGRPDGPKADMGSPWSGLVVNTTGDGVLTGALQGRFAHSRPDLALSRPDPVPPGWASLGALSSVRPPLAATAWSQLPCTASSLGCCVPLGLASRVVRRWALLLELCASVTMVCRPAAVGTAPRCGAWRSACSVAEDVAACVCQLPRWV
jgi:hypothetical protein